MCWPVLSNGGLETKQIKRFKLNAYGELDALIQSKEKTNMYIIVFYQSILFCPLQKVCE